MEFSEVFKVGLAILSSLGGATLILFAFSSWLGKVWAGRILETEKSKLASELETIKASNQNFVNAIGVSNTLYVESQKVFASERVSAIKSLWFEFILLKKHKPSSITFLDLLSFEEYKQIYKNSNFNYFDDDLSIEKLAELMKIDIEELRPFIDEKSYSYFWSYRALIGRMSSYIKNIRDKGQPEKPWQEDMGVLEVIKPILSNSELSKFKTENWSSQVLFGYIETALSQHLRDISSGTEVSKESLEHSMSLHKAAENLKKIENAEMS